MTNEVNRGARPLEPDCALDAIFSFAADDLIEASDEDVAAYAASSNTHDAHVVAWMRASISRLSAPVSGEAQEAGAAVGGDQAADSAPTNVVQLPQMTVRRHAALAICDRSIDVGGVATSARSVGRSRVFISYDRHDAQKARAISDAISGLGFDVLFDVTVSSATRSWRADLRRAIDACDVFVLLWGPNSYCSDQVHWELECARERLASHPRGLKIVPVPTGADSATPTSSFLDYRMALASHSGCVQEYVSAKALLSYLDAPAISKCEMDPDRVLAFLKAAGRDEPDARLAEKLILHDREWEAVLALHQGISRRDRMGDAPIVGALVRGRLDGVHDASVMSGAVIGRRRAASAVMRELVRAGANRGWMVNQGQEANVAVTSVGVMTRNQRALSAGGFHAFTPPRGTKHAVSSLLGSVVMMRQRAVGFGYWSIEHVLERAFSEREPTSNLGGGRRWFDLERFFARNRFR